MLWRSIFVALDAPNYYNQQSAFLSAASGASSGGACMHFVLLSNFIVANALRDVQSLFDCVNIEGKCSEEIRSASTK